ncbi:MAG: SpoIID/LytB domain-containing protein [Elusimicrobia bacterium]|nr:SpoIID/LytB domain-containing protein [Elusimicrobiota bacterium]
MGSIPITRWFFPPPSDSPHKKIKSGPLRGSIIRFLFLVAAVLARPAAAQTAAEAPPIALSSGVAVATQTAPAPPAPARAAVKATPALARARALYFSGDVLIAAEAFEKAVKTSPADVSAWRDGSIAWGEAGRPEKAVAYARRAAALDADSRTRTALGWALLREADYADSEAAFADALARDPENSWAALGSGCAELALGRAAQAVPLLKRAGDDALLLTLSSFYLGRAEEALGDPAAAAEAYKRAVVGDAYFHEGRNPLTRVYLKLKRYNDAWRQLTRLAEAEPSARLTRALMDKVRPLLTGSAEPRHLNSGRPPISAPATDSETQGGIPLIRVGIGVTALGKPRPRKSVTVRGSGPWHAYDPKTGRTLAECGAQEAWTVRIVPPKKRKGRARLELRGPDGEVRVVPGDLVRLEPKDPVHGALSLEDDPRKGGPLGTGRAMRGSIEAALFNRRRSLRLVNIVNLEDYTEGVVGAEMPSNSPLESLKAQALIARTHALLIKTVSKRHRREGYDVCDDQHCQVYAGLRAENERTRAAVAATRGQVAVYKGQLAHVLYSSNCGGSSQSGDDIGWGHVPYWTRASDSPAPIAPPASPSELRHYLSTWPATYDKPSGYVHPSHSRWARVIAAKDLEERVNRRHKIGRLKGLRVLRRAPTGNVEALLLLGSKRNLKLTDEFAIRGVLGAGSLRSTLFVVDTEYARETIPAPKKRKGHKAPAPKSVLVPKEFVFRGGGWGHAVGLCQSGAIGRAEAGQDYETIVKAYFAGVQLTSLDYTTMRP